jgi:hypothetical protein
MAWNDTAERCSLSATGGGASIFFAKPAWQAGPGVRNRALPWQTGLHPAAYSTRR